MLQMKFYLDKYIKTTFFFEFLKSSIYNTLAIVSKLFASYITNKLIALIGGVNSFSIVSQMQNLSTILQGIITAPVNLPLIKQISYNESDILESICTTAITIAILTGIVLFLPVWLFNDEISFFLVGNYTYSSFIPLVSLSVFFSIVNTFFLAILNATSQERKYAIITVISSIITIISVVCCVYFIRTNGILYSIIVPNICICIYTIIAMQRSLLNNKKYRFRISDFNYSIASKISKTAGAAISITVLGLISQIILRKTIIVNISPVEASLWDAITKFSLFYMIVFNSIIQLYFFPKFSKNQYKINHKASIDILKRSFKITYFFYFLIITVLLIFRHLIIQLIFSKDFLAIDNLMVLQFMADLFKIGGFILGNYMLTQSLYKNFITLEIVFTLFYFLSGFILLRIIGVKGLIVADLIKSAFYLFFLTVYIKSKFKDSQENI